MAMASAMGVGEDLGVTSRSLRTLPPFGRRRGMLDGSVRRRSTSGADQVALDGADRLPGSEPTPARQPENRADHSPDDAG